MEDNKQTMVADNEMQPAVSSFKLEDGLLTDEQMTEFTDAWQAATKAVIDEFSKKYPTLVTTVGLTTKMVYIRRKEESEEEDTDDNYILSASDASWGNTVILTLTSVCDNVKDRNSRAILRAAGNTFLSKELSEGERLFKAIKHVATGNSIEDLAKEEEERDNENPIEKLRKMLTGQD